MKSFIKSVELTPVERIKKLKFPEKIDADLAYFCGFMAGDGSMGFRKDKNDYWVSCVGNAKDEREYYDIVLKELIKKLFNLDIKPKLKHKNTCYGFSFSSKNFVRYLNQVIGLPLGKKYEKLAIPKIFLNDSELVGSFIAGVADTDFHLAIKKRNYPVIKGVSKSRQFIEEIKCFLDNEGFRVCIYERKQDDERFKKGFAITHHIEMSGFEQLRKWLDKVGSRHPKMLKKIQFLKENNKL